MEPTAAPWARGPIDGTPRPSADAMGPPLPPQGTQLPPSAIRPGTPFTGVVGRAAPAGEPEPVPGRYFVPRKVIASPMDVTRYCGSETYAATLQFARDLQAAARGRQLRAEVAMSPMCTQTVTMLGQMEGWVEAIPPHEQAMRFGNRAFKEWHAKLVADLPALLAELLACAPGGPEALSDAAAPTSAVPSATLSGLTTGRVTKPCSPAGCSRCCALEGLYLKTCPRWRCGCSQPT